MKDGEEITYSVDTGTGVVIGASLITSTYIPPTCITLTNPEGKEANIDFGGDKLEYSGDLEISEAAKMFFEEVFLNYTDFAKYKDKYFDLLWQVEEKYPNEDRHQTAKRLLRKAQRSNDKCQKNS